MRLNWIDTRELSFNSLLLLERVQISWLQGWVPEEPLTIALHANPVVEWYLRHKCPQVADWVDNVIAAGTGAPTPEFARAAEQEILATINDLLVYAIDPGIYDSQPFLKWDSAEVLELIDFSGRIVIDIGAGTGRLTFTVAEQAAVVFAVEPVGNLRQYIREKARTLNLDNVYTVDGLITQIPYPNDFADVTMGGFVYGEHPEPEIIELERVTKPGGWVILCPGNVDRDTDAHQALVNHQYAWARFEAPDDGWKRKYWKKIG